MSALPNKVALITGASSGIGYAAAKRFAREGVKVVIAARRQAELDALVEETTHVQGPEEIAQSALSLASDASSFTTGSRCWLKAGFLSTEPEQALVYMPW